MAVDLIELRGVRCEVLRRVNRFVVAMRSPEGTSLAHLNNTGRLLEYMVPGGAAYCVPRTAPGATRYRLVAFEDRGGPGAALVDTSYQMSALEAALRSGALPWAQGCSVARRSPRLGDSVLDYVFDCGAAIYVEVKSAAMRGPGDLAMYPDCPTERGRRQISTMIEWSSRGIGSLIVFIAALPGVVAFAPNGSGDPVIPGLLRMARSAGVGLRAISMHYDGSRVLLDDPDLPVLL
ncbi:MAG: DNA/RNA nuclease SfsA [Nitrososphaeria archaeon]